MRLTHIALAAALSSPLTRAPAAALNAPPAAANEIVSLVSRATPRSDRALSTAVQSLLKDAPPPPAAVDFAEAAGTWRVVSAPLIDTLSSVALTKFDITYRIGSGGTIGATVRYDSRLVGNGWLCTDGTISNDAGASPTVRLIWRRVWWQPGGEADAPPLDPDAEGATALKPLVQAIGRAGFSPDLAVFPVAYFDASGGLAVFKFQSLTVAVQRVDS